MFEKFNPRKEKSEKQTNKWFDFFLEHVKSYGEITILPGFSFLMKMASSARYTMHDVHEEFIQSLLAKKAERRH